MRGAGTPRTTMDGIYQILIKEALDPEWSAWFDDMTITRDTAGATILEGPVIDQAALYGLIGRARDLGLTLLGVAMCDADERDGRTASLDA